MMRPEDRLALRVVCRDHLTRVLFRQCLDMGEDNWLEPYSESVRAASTWIEGYGTPEARAHFMTGGRSCPRCPTRTTEIGADRLIAVLRAVSTIEPAPHTWSISDLDLSRLLGRGLDDWSAADTLRALTHCNDTRSAVVRRLPT
jgi:hypothetical protein